MSSLDMSVLENDEYIDGLTLRDAVALTRQYRISTVNKVIRTLPDLRCLIKLHAVMHRDQTKDAASLVLLKLRKDDEIRRHTLFNTCDEVKEEAEKLIESNNLIHDQLNINLPKYREKMTENVEQLTEDQCPVLVLGESSAGKSSFINLILGEELLPCYHMSNTSVICEIKYSDKYCAIIYPWSGDHKIVIGEDDLGPVSEGNVRDAFVKKLANYIQEKEERDKWKYKRARIGMPCAVLKTGLCIVDSPGIGENKELTELVLDYMFKSFAFVYVINSMNAGGLESEGIQSLVRGLAEERKKEHSTHFLPQSAMFICNKWDLVSVPDRLAVMEDTKEKLKKFWPGFQESQVYQMSTMEARYMMRHDYSSSQLMKILQGLQTMIPYGLECRIAYSFDYFMFLVQRVMTSSLSYIEQKKLSEDERFIKIQQIETRLKKMKQESEEFFRSQRQALEKSKREAAAAMKEHFQKDETIERICTWRQSDVPQRTTWKEVELSIRAKTYEKISTEVTRLEEDRGFFRKKRQVMLDEFRETFMVLEKKLLTIEKIMSGETHSIYADKETINAESSILASLGWSRLTRGRKIIVGLSAPLLAPIAIIGLVISLPVLGILKIRDTVMLYKIKENTQEYNRNPREFMSRYSSEILQKFLSDSNLKNFVKEELQVVYEFLDQLQKAEQKQRESDVFLLSKLRDEINNVDIDYQQHIELHERYMNLWKRLQWFKVTKMIRGDIEYVCTDTLDVPCDWLTFNLEKDQVICEGIKAVMYKGSFSKEDNTKPVSVRLLNIPLSPSNINQYIEEEKAYRYAVNDSHLVNLMAVTKDFQRVFQIFDDLHCSLRTHILEKKTVLDDDIGWESLKSGVANSVVDGLVYIHGRERVHFDLSLDTVAVTSAGQVKLTNISCQTTLDIISRRQLMGTFDRQIVYIPQEVVQCDDFQYNKSSDIYALGVLLWELCTCELAFEDMVSDPDKGIATGSDFYDCVNMMGVSNALYVNYRSDISETWKHVICNCLAADADVRRSGAAIRECLQDPPDDC